MSHDHDESSQQLVELEDGDDSSNAAPDEEVTISAQGLIPRNEFKWNEKSVRLLLELKFEREDEFLRPSCRKVKIWEQIGNEMQRHGFLVNGHTCDSKYRNLLATYRKNKIKQQTSEEPVTISWEFFELMDDHLGSKFNLATENFDYSIQPSTPAPESDYEDQRIIFTKTPTKRARLSSIRFADEEPKMSIQEYFYEKLQFDRSCYTDDVKRKTKRLELQERKIKLQERQLEMECKKVEALTALAKAISSLKAIVP